MIGAVTMYKVFSYNKNQNVESILHLNCCPKILNHVLSKWRTVNRVRLLDGFGSGQANDGGGIRCSGCESRWDKEILSVFCHLSLSLSLFLSLAGQGGGLCCERRHTIFLSIPSLAWVIGNIIVTAPKQGIDPTVW